MMLKKIIKRSWKTFLVFFVFVFLVLNWNSAFKMSQYLDYRVIVSVFKNIGDKITPDIKIKASNETQQTILKQAFLSIPQLGIKAPLQFVEKQGAQEIEASLDRGVLYYPGTALPNETGQGIVLGHSAPEGWPKINYDWVFSDLSQLKKGDKFYIETSNQTYTYAVRERLFLDKGQEVPEFQPGPSKHELVLITCWPPGKNRRRFAVRGELEK